MNGVRHRFKRHQKLWLAILATTFRDIRAAIFKLAPELGETPFATRYRQDYRRGQS